MPESKPIPVTWMWRGRKQHFVTELTDGDTRLVVYKSWNKGKKSWSYVAEPLWLVEYTLKLIEKG